MVEQNIQSLARGMRNTGWVRLFTHDLEPKTPMNTSPGDIVHMVVWKVFEENPEIFRKDDRSEERAEIRYHWKDLTEDNREKVLSQCLEKIARNEIVKERNLQATVFDQVYRLLNLQAT